VAADRVVFLAVTGRGMHRAGAVGSADVIAEQDRHITLGIKRVDKDHAFQRLALGAGENLPWAQPVAGEGRFEQRFGQHQKAPLTVALGAFDQHILNFRAQRHRQRGGQRPRGGGPDRDGDFGRIGQVAAKGRPQRLRITRGIGDIDRRRDLVLILDLGLGQRRAAIKLTPRVRWPLAITLASARISSASKRKSRL